jgi:hypothetical protein
MVKFRAFLPRLEDDQLSVFLTGWPPSTEKEQRKNVAQEPAARASLVVRAAC